MSIEFPPASPTIPPSSKEWMATLSAYSRLSPAFLGCYLTRGKFQIPPHIALLSRAVRDAVLGIEPRVIVSMPPRHGKSQTTSKWSPVWFLDRFPDRMVGLASYEANFAAKWGREARDTLNAHRGCLNARIRRDTSAANEWMTTEGGGMKTAGVGGPFTGYGYHLLIVDDAIKNSQEAASETTRETSWEWWQSTAYTRLEPGGAAVVVMTRWHLDDLVGRIKKQMADDPEAERWREIRLPAIAEDNDPIGRKPGQALWPARYPLEALLRIKRAVGSYVWGSLYQQDPRTRDGGMFNENWFDIVPKSTSLDIVKEVRSWDLAATPPSAENPDPDYLCGVKMAQLANGKFLIRSRTKNRGTPDQVEKTVKADALLDGVNCQIGIEIEPGSASKISFDHFARHVLRGFDVRPNRPKGKDKVLRAGPFSAACERGDVLIEAGPWVRDFLDCLTAFPGAKHDDDVDAASGAYLGLTMGFDAWTADDFQKLFGDAEPQDRTKALLLARLRGAGDLESELPEIF